MKGGASPGMVLWLSELKLCREMGTNPRRVTLHVQTGYPNPQGQWALIKGFWVPCSLNHVVCLGLDVPSGLDFAAGWSFVSGCWGFAAGLEFAKGVENALGEARYLC